MMLAGKRILITGGIGLSTHKARQPISAMGMARALRERLHGRASPDCPAPVRSPKTRW
jgi:hypothetical protein